MRSAGGGGDIDDSHSGELRPSEGEYLAHWQGSFFLVILKGLWRNFGLFKLHQLESSSCQRQDNVLTSDEW